MDRFKGRPKARPKIGEKAVWDGHFDSFNAYEQLIDGHLLQVGAHYVADAKFLKAYQKEGEEYLTSIQFWEDYGISIPQARYDNTYVYGMLKSTNRKVKSEILQSHEGDQDGFLAWKEFKDRYQYNGSKRLESVRLEKLARSEYEPGYKGGVTQYLED